MPFCDITGVFEVFEASEYSQGNDMNRIQCAFFAVAYKDKYSSGESIYYVKNAPL